MSVLPMKQSKIARSKTETTRHAGSQTVDRKAMQLCSQVRYALEYVINDVLKGEYGLTVTDVVPAPNTSHLLVFVQSFEELSFDESVQLESELNSHSKSLRSVVIAMMVSRFAAMNSCRSMVIPRPQ